MLKDGQKWACEACVRGHRVTTCKHHDRPLIRINRKGRPFSTCSVCHCTPCRSPEEHAKFKRESDPKASSKKAPGRHSRSNNLRFLPIAPRPPPESEQQQQQQPRLSGTRNPYRPGIPAVTSYENYSAPGPSASTPPGGMDMISSLDPRNIPVSAASSTSSVISDAPMSSVANHPFEDLDLSFADNAFPYLEDLDGMPPDDVLAEEWSNYFFCRDHVYD